MLHTHNSHNGANLTLCRSKSFGKMGAHCRPNRAAAVEGGLLYDSSGARLRGATLPPNTVTSIWVTPATSDKK